VREWIKYPVSGISLYIWIQIRRSIYFQSIKFIAIYQSGGLGEDLFIVAEGKFCRLFLQTLNTAKKIVAVIPNHPQWVIEECYNSLVIILITYFYYICNVYLYSDILHV